MCGIVACFARRETVSESVLARATESLYHRGPDGRRHWISADRTVGLGHARLSIIDLTTGDQPIASEDERTHIVVNGEFYGFEAIQRELGGARPPPPHAVRQRDRAAPLGGLSAPSACTTCAASSPSCCGTRRAGRSFAARDRFGIKPLFYALAPRTRSTSPRR